MLEPALLQPDCEQHHYRLGTGHLGGQQFERRGDCRGADFSEGHGFSPGVKKPPSGGLFENQDTAIAAGSWHSVSVNFALRERTGSPHLFSRPHTSATTSTAHGQMIAAHS